MKDCKYNQHDSPIECRAILRKSRNLDLIAYFGRAIRPQKRFSIRLHCFKRMNQLNIRACRSIGMRHD